MEYTNKIYLGTVCLEVNRWTSKEPSFLVSDWLERIRDAGFDGIELWENHALLASPEERQRIKDDPFPVFFNSYAGLDDESDAAREKATELAKYFNAGGIKFNSGNEPAKLAEYQKNLKHWSQQFPDDFRFLSECHPNTLFEDPETAHQSLHREELVNVGIIQHLFWDRKALLEWFKLFGDKLSHMHIQLRNPDNSCALLADKPDRVKEAVALLREQGFSGSFTIEFVEGTRTDNENIEDLFKNAVSDLNTLKKALM